MPHHRPFAAKITLSERLAAAFASLYFSVPTCALLWLFLNSQLILVYELFLPKEAFFTLIAALAFIGFSFPRSLPTVFGWLWEALLGLLEAW